LSASSVIDQTDVTGIWQDTDDNKILSSLLHCKLIIYELWAAHDSSSSEVNELITIISPLSVPIATRFWL